MRTVRYTRQFKKDFKSAKRQGKNLDNLQRVDELILIRTGSHAQLFEK